MAKLIQRLGLAGILGLSYLVAGCNEVGVGRGIKSSNLKVDYTQNNQGTMTNIKNELPPIYFRVGTSPYYPHISYGPGGSFVEW